jgi:hypothetical protein
MEENKERVENIESEFEALLQTWEVAPISVEARVMAAISAQTPSGNTSDSTPNNAALEAILQEIQAMRRDIAGLREDVRAIQRERSREREGTKSSALGLMPFTSVDDRPLWRS